MNTAELDEAVAALHDVYRVTGSESIHEWATSLDDEQVWDYLDAIDHVHSALKREQRTRRERHRRGS